MDNIEWLRGLGVTVRLEAGLGWDALIADDGNLLRINADLSGSDRQNVAQRVIDDLLGE